MTTPPAGTFDRPQHGAYSHEPTPSKSRPFLLVALAVVAALVIGGGAWAVTRSLGGGGDQPASALPADTAAYLRVDIDPSLGQKIAAVRFADGLDDKVLETLRDGDIRELAFDWLADEEPAFAAIDYAEDIEPWLGDRLGMGIIPNGENEPYAGIALQVKDEKAADAGLTKLQATTNTAGAESAESADGLDWFFHGDYAVLTTTDAVGPMQNLVEAGTLADKDTFSDDMDALGDQGVLSGWVDVEPLAALADSPLAQATVSDVAPLDPSGALGSMAGTSEFAQDALTGRYAAALRFSETSVEVHGVGRGVQGIGVEGGDSAHLILDLPEDTAGALSLEHGDQLVAELYTMLQEQIPQEVADAEAEVAEMGFTLPDDLQTLVGSSLVLSVGPGIVGLEQDDNPEFYEIAYRTATDTDAAEDLISRAFGASGEPQAEEALVRRADDGVLTLGISDSYVNTVADGGALGNHPLFKDAVPGAADADSVFYVNMNTFEDLYLPEVSDPEARSSLEQLAAIGWSSSMDQDGNADFTLRLVADE